ncbi:MAG: M14 family metallopeptidase [Gemmatimonadota bacterium]|nr:M14 family metallopeptidase [Gemmatimonadota bacterium]
MLHPTRRVTATLFPLIVSGLTMAAPALRAQGSPDSALLTRPESTDFRETSRHADVLAFLKTAAARAPEMLHLGTFGYSLEGRPLPLAVWGRVADASPEAVLASGKTRILVQANIHAGEVEGKEASLILLRALVAGEHREWADSLVLLFIPIYNADGNERIGLLNRPHQHGPVGGMGERTNAQGLDLNRDHTKVDSPEARALLGVLNRYDPHVGVDLHTTNGTYHAYHLTYSPPLHPNTHPGIVQTLRGDWLPEVTRELREQDGWETYYYGNVPSAESLWAAAEGAPRGWYTFDHRPRFNNNYLGLRNRFAILSEAYAYLTFAERIRTTRRFVEEVLDWAHGHAIVIRRATAEADATRVVGERLALSARPVNSGPVEILMGAVTEEKNPYSGAVMMRRLDVRRPERMPEFGSFEAVETARAPRAYLVPAALTGVLDRLEAHGVRMRVLQRPTPLRVEEFVIDSTRVAERPFQGHRERTLSGRYLAAERTLPAGTRVAEVDQPLGRLVFTLLEPRSDDGFLNWGLLDEALEGATVYPVTRTQEPVP